MQNDSTIKSIHNEPLNSGDRVHHPKHGFGTVNIENGAFWIGFTAGAMFCISATESTTLTGVTKL